VKINFTGGIKASIKINISDPYPGNQILKINFNKSQTRRLSLTSDAFDLDWKKLTSEDRAASFVQCFSENLA